MEIQEKVKGNPFRHSDLDLSPSGLAKKEIGRVPEEIRERDKADRILIIGLIACVKEERLGNGQRGIP